MRAQLLGLAATSLLFLPGSDCCGVGEPQLAARYSAYDGCDFYSCPLAVGSEVQVFMESWTTETEDENRIRRASLDDPSLGELALYEGDVLVRPLVAGQVTLTATLADKSQVSAYMVFADRASTKILAPSISHNTYPPGLPQVFAGTAFNVLADHLDAAGNSLLGSGLEDWSVTGGEFVPYVDPNPMVDLARVRRVQVGGDPKLVVSARPDGMPLEVEVLPGGSTASLGLEWDFTTLRNSGQFSLSAGYLLRIAVYPYAANGRFIYGMPVGGSLTATTDNFDVATAQRAPGGGMQIDVLAVAPGSTVMTVAFDGMTWRFRIDVY